MTALRDELERGLARLTVELRTALVLHHYLGYSFPEIGDALGIPTGTAKSRVHRATQMMRTALLADARLPHRRTDGRHEHRPERERFPDIDRSLQTSSRRTLRPEPPPLIPALLARTALTRQRPAWRIPSRWLPPNVAWRPRTHGRLNTMATPIQDRRRSGRHRRPRRRRRHRAKDPGPGGNEPGGEPVALADAASPVGGDVQPGTSRPGRPTSWMTCGTTGSADLILTVPATGWLHAVRGHLAKDLIADPLGDVGGLDHPMVEGQEPDRRSMSLAERGRARSTRGTDRRRSCDRAGGAGGGERVGPDRCDGRWLPRQEGRAVATRWSRHRHV